MTEASTPHTPEEEEGQVMRGVAALAEQMLAERDGLADLISAEIIERIPEYAELPDAHAEVARYAVQSVESIATGLRSSPSPEGYSNEAAPRIAQARAEQGFPLSASLQSYQIGVRVIWEWARQRKAQDPSIGVLAELSGWLMAYVEASSMAAATVFARVQTSQQHQLRAKERDCLEWLLTNAPTPAGADIRLAEWGFLPRARMFLVVVRSLDGAPAHETGYAERLREFFGERTEGVIISTRFTDTIMLTAPRADEDMVALLGQVWNGSEMQDLRCVVSRPFRGGEGAAQHYRHGQMAVGAATADHPVVDAGTLPVAAFAMHLAGQEVAQMIPQEYVTFVQRDRENAGTLMETVTAYLESGMNVARTAKKLFAHPNTIYYRLQQVQSQAGVGSHDLWGLLDLYCAALVAAEPEPSVRPEARVTGTGAGVGSRLGTWPV